VARTLLSAVIADDLIGVYAEMEALHHLPDAAVVCGDHTAEMAGRSTDHLLYGSQSILSL